MSGIAPLFIIVAAALWGVDGIILRPKLYSLPVFLVVFVESSIVALLLTPVFAREVKKLRALERGDWLAFVGVAVFGGAIGTMAITKALFYVDYVNLSIVVLIQKLQPAWAIALAAVLLKEKLPREFFLWAGLAITGAYLMTFGFAAPDMIGGDMLLQAAGFALLAVIGFGSSTVFSKRALKRVNFGMGTYLRFLLTSGLMLLLVAFAGEITLVNTVDTEQWQVFLLIAFSTGGGAIFLYYYGLKRVRASVATICELAFPLSAILLEYFVRGNILSMHQWIGVLLLFISIIRVTRFEEGTS